MSRKLLRLTRVVVDKCRREAGRDVIGHFLKSRDIYAADVVKPPIGKDEFVYIIPGTDAEEKVTGAFATRGSITYRRSRGLLLTIVVSVNFILIVVNWFRLIDRKTKCLSCRLANK
jgi:hypothetical protein